MLHFQYTEYFLTLAVVPVLVLLYFLIRGWKRKVAAKIGDPQLVRQLTEGYSPARFRVKFAAVVLALVLCSFALAGLVLPDGTQKIHRRGVDLVFALDVSKSMLAQDIRPDRLERAKQLISKIIDDSPDDNIGLVIFAGRAYLQMPITIDHEAAKMYLSTASPDDVPTQGTVISDALNMSAAAFDSNEKTYKSIILVSDGEDHDDDAIKAAKALGKAGIEINTIGIGSPMGAPIFDPQTNSEKRDDKGNLVITKLNEQELRDIAKAGNGTYQLYSSTDQVASNLENQLKGIGQATVSDSSYEGFIQYFQYFLAGALVLLLLEFFISEKKKIRKPKAVLGILVLGLCFHGQSYGQSATNEIFRGNQAYLKSQYDQAENSYLNALKLSGDNPTASFNLGNTMYRKNQTDQAVDSYEKTIQNATDPDMKEQAWYNRGVAYQKAKKLPECIQSYENALMLNPNDQEARQNLERALQEQKNQQQPQNSQNKKQPKKNNKQNNQKNNPQNKPQQEKQPQSQQPKMSKQDAEEKLKSLLENEKELQDKLHKIKGAAAPDKPEKDW
ncbi:MAG: VWA domain-containing protein [Bacteroidota bacterium]|nr:VWA domain-containing protein [Bacteroidota bacterium]